MDQFPKRKNIRLRNYNYRSKAVYHVTICTDRRICLFGSVTNGGMVLTPAGMVADENVQGISERYPEAEVIAHVVMPNHVHLLLGLGTGAGANYGAPTVPHTLGQIVRAYKASVSAKVGQSI